MFNLIRILAMRLSVFDGINRQSIIPSFLALENGQRARRKNTRYAVKLSRVSFFNLTILSLYRWLVKLLAQLQVTLVGSDRCLYLAQEKSFLGTFSFSFLLGVFFSLSFKIDVPMRNCDVLRIRKKEEKKINRIFNH